MMLKALVADDEALARDELVYALRQVGGVDSIDQVTSAVEALERLQDSHYDVLFLDIRMPGLSGLDAMGVVNRLPERPQVVFVTAYDEHALEAFDVAAADYLLKPVSAPRLQRALARVGRQRTLAAATRSSFWEDRQRAKTASVMRVSGMPRSVAEATIHLPVPFWPAASRIRSTRGLPLSGSR